MLDASGRIVFQSEFVGGTNELELQPAHKLAPGVYIVTVQHGDWVGHRRLVVN